MKVLFVTPWNTSNPAAYLARDFARTHTENNYVVLCPGQETWAEDFNVDGVQVHTFGETLHFEDGEEHTYDPQMHQLDFVLIQLVFYCKTYNIDKIVIFGTLFSVFEIVARVRLMKNAAESSSQPFEVPVRAVLTSFGTNTNPDVPATMYTETFADVVESIFVLSNGEDNRLHDLFVLTADENPNFPDVEEFTPTYTSNVSIQAGRAALESTVGLRLPSHSKVVLSLNPTAEQARTVASVANDVFELRPDLMSNDALLFWIVQFAPGSDELVQAIQTSPYATHILYTGSKIMTDAVAAIHDSVDTLILSDPYFHSSGKYSNFDPTVRGDFTHEPVMPQSSVTRRVLQLVRTGVQRGAHVHIQALPDFVRE